MPPLRALAKFVPDSFNRSIVSRLDLEIFETGSAVSRAWDYRSFQIDPFFRLYYAVKGKVGLRFADGVYPVEGGNLYLIPANVPFCYVPHRPLHHYWLHFSSSLLEKIPYFRQLLAVPITAFPDIRNTMETFLALADKTDKIEAIMQMDIIVRQLLTPFIAQLPEEENNHLLDRLDVFSRILDYIDTHLDQELTTPELAALVKMKRNAFSASFHQTFGIPPKQYIARRRIDRAKIMLIRTRLPIKEIAAQVGYDNEFFFYRIFRKYARITPGEYRNANNPCRM